MVWYTKALSRARIRTLATMSLSTPVAVAGRKGVSLRHRCDSRSTSGSRSCTLSAHAHEDMGSCPSSAERCSWLAGAPLCCVALPMEQEDGKREEVASAREAGRAQRTGNLAGMLAGRRRAQLLQQNHHSSMDYFMCESC